MLSGENSMIDSSISLFDVRVKKESCYNETDPLK